MSLLSHCPGSRCWNKVPLSWYQELLEVLKLKPEAGQAVAFHALPTARNSAFQISAYPVLGILPFKFLLSHFIQIIFLQNLFNRMCPGSEDLQVMVLMK